LSITKISSLFAKLVSNILEIKNFRVTANFWGLSE